MLLNWIDLLFIGIFFYFSFRGWRNGFIYLVASFFAFGISQLIAFKYARSISLFFSSRFGIVSHWSSVVAYFLLAFVIEIIISELLNIFLHKTPNKVIQSRFNQILGTVFSAGSGLFFLTVFLFVLLFIPVRGSVKKDIRSSMIAPPLLSILETRTGPLPEYLKMSAKQLTQFITVAPKSDEKILLDEITQESDLRIDEKTELAMISLVNAERAKVGAGALTMDSSIRDVARMYSKKMLLERFFSHYDNEGNDVGDRLSSSRVPYFVAGENLAYAPDLTSAHQGLMNSEGHKRNILDPQFRRIGIGIIDAGPWGKMFTQVFAD